MTRDAAAIDAGHRLDARGAAAEEPARAMSDGKREVIERCRRHLMPARVAAWENLGVPLVVGRREGYRIWDVDGHELLDLHLNGGTYNLGHRHPSLLARLRRDLDTLDVGNHHFPSCARADLAEKLARLAPGRMPLSVFVPSGSEANDLAIRIARRATGRRKIVALEAGFHGRTGLSAAAGRDDMAKYFLSDYPNEFVTVAFDDLAAMERALAAGDVAAVLMETIPATYGFPVPSRGYLAGVKAACERYGTLYVADEVQTGLGRTGHLWGVQAFGVEPDMMVVGKGLSGGLYPMCAVTMTESVGAWLSEQGWGYVSTFGGAELGCGVASEVLDICSRPDVLAGVERISRRVGDGLAQLRGRHPFLVGVRQQGVVIGLETAGSLGAMQLSRALYRRGVWAMFSGFAPDVLQFKVGLLVDDAFVDELLGKLDAALGDVAAEVG